MKSMRFKYILLSILLVGGLDVFAQESGEMFPIYDFSLRNAVYDCFNALQSGNSRLEGMLLSEQAVAEDPNFPDIVRTLLAKTRSELSSSVSSPSSTKPYVKYEYKYVSRNDVSYVIGVAVAELLYADTGASYNMISRPMYYVYTSRGWKAFWLSRSWSQARFLDNETIVIQDEENPGITLSNLITKLRDEFVSQLVGKEMKTQVQVQSQSQSQSQTRTQMQTSVQELNDVISPSSDSQGPISYDVATVKPTFGGRPASEFTDWVRRHLKYPDSARKRGLSGTAKVQFVIDPEGKVTDVKVIESSGKRSRQEFESQVSMASYIASQYKTELQALKDRTDASIQSIMDMQKLFEQAQQRENRLKKLLANKTYVLPEYDILDKEAVRVIASSPDWEPGEYREFPVPVEYTVSVEIKP